MNLDWIVRVPFGATMAAVTLLLIAGLEVFSAIGRSSPRWWRPLSIMMVVVVGGVIVARFVRFV